MCNLRKGFNLEPVVKDNFFLGTQITVTSLPFGWPRLRITGGIVTSIPQITIEHIQLPGLIYGLYKDKPVAG